MTIVVKAWADIACPLSYLCAHRLTDAVTRYREAGGTHDVTIEYHSIELASDTPLDFEGNEIDFLTSARGMTADEARQALGRLATVAAAEGITLDFERVRHANSRLAHQLVHHAAAHGEPRPMLDRLWSAYFTEGRSIAGVDDLADLAAEVGLDRATARAALEADTYAAAVNDDIERAGFYRIRVLPFFLFGSGYGVSGAHDTGYYVEMLTKAATAADA